MAHDDWLRNGGYEAIDVPPLLLPELLAWRNHLKFTVILTGRRRVGALTLEVQTREWVGAQGIRRDELVARFSGGVLPGEGVLRRRIMSTGELVFFSVFTAGLFALLMLVGELRAPKKFRCAHRDYELRGHDEREVSAAFPPARQELFSRFDFRGAGAVVGGDLFIEGPLSGHTLATLDALARHLATPT